MSIIQCLRGDWILKHLMNIEHDSQQWYNKSILNYIFEDKEKLTNFKP